MLDLIDLASKDDGICNCGGGILSIYLNSAPIVDLLNNIPNLMIHRSVYYLDRIKNVKL